LVRDRGNGLVFQAGNIAALADALRLLIANAQLRERMGKVSRDIIARWNYSECEVGLSVALAAVGIAVTRSSATSAAAN
jgi:glycosyltransferase involved in cell wall biosynthesis